MFDCHAHLACAELDADRQSVLQTAASQGVSGIIVVSEGTHDAQAVLELCRNGVALDSEQPRLHAALGTHPCSATTDDLDAMLQLIRQHAEAIVCIGEVTLRTRPMLCNSPIARFRLPVMYKPMRLRSQHCRLGWTIAPMC